MTDSNDTPMSAHHPPGASEIEIESGVGYDSRLGFVTLRLGGRGGQLTTKEARAHAMNVLDAAAAADYDASVLRLLMKTGWAVDQAAGFLIELRQHRQAIDEEGGNT